MWESVIGMVSRSSGDTAAAISREAAIRGADLIVLQSRRKRLSAALFGSTAEEVCHTAPCPVLVTHPREHEFIDEKTYEVHLSRILAGDDFSAYSTAALKFAFSLAQEFQSELHVLHVEESKQAAAAHGQEGLHLIDNATEYIEERLKSHLSSDVELWCSVKPVVREGHPDHEIAHYAAEQNIDLICVGSHGRGKRWGALLGSTTDCVLRRAPCPMLVTRPSSMG